MQPLSPNCQTWDSGAVTSMPEQASMMANHVGSSTATIGHERHKFSQSETDTLVSLVGQYRSINHGRINETGWIDIARALNNSGYVTVHRSLHEVRRKWKNLAYHARQMASQINLRRDRGGGLPPRLQTSVRVLKILNVRRSCAVFPGSVGASSLPAHRRPPVMTAAMQPTNNHNHYPRGNTVKAQLMASLQQQQQQQQQDEQNGDVHIVKVEEAPPDQRDPPHSPILPQFSPALADPTGSSGSINNRNDSLISSVAISSIASVKRHRPVERCSFLPMEPSPHSSIHPAEVEEVATTPPSSSTDAAAALLLKLQEEKMMLERDILMIKKSRAELKRHRDEIKLEREIFRFEKERRRSGKKRSSEDDVTDVPVPSNVSANDAGSGSDHADC